MWRASPRPNRQEVGDTRSQPFFCGPNGSQSWWLIQIQTHCSARPAWPRKNTSSGPSSLRMLDSNFVSPSSFASFGQLPPQMDNLGAHINAKPGMGSILADRIDLDRPVFVWRLSIWDEDPEFSRSRLCPQRWRPAQRSRRSLANCFGLLPPHYLDCPSSGSIGYVRH